MSLSAVRVGRLLRCCCAPLGLFVVAAAVAGLAGRPRSRGALARRGVPGDPHRGEEGGGHGVLRRRTSATRRGSGSDYHAGTTWAPVGQTPIVKATGAWHSLRMISAVTAQGLLRLSTYTAASPARGSSVRQEAHARHRPPGLPGRRRPPHPRFKLVKKFAACTNGRFKLFVLPAYSPQQTPTRGCGRTSSTTVSGAPASRPRRVQDQGHQVATPPAETSAHRPGVLHRPPTSATSPHDQVNRAIR